MRGALCKMPWFSTASDKKPPATLFSSLAKLPLHQGLVLGGAASIALQNVLSQTHHYVRIVVREAIDRIYPSESPYTIVPLRDYAPSSEYSIFSNQLESLILTHFNLYYVYPKTLHIYECIQYAKNIDDPPQSHCYKLNPYVHSLLQKINLQKHFQTDLRLLLHSFLLHMLLNDCRIMHQKKPSSPLAAIIDALIQACKAPQKPQRSRKGLFYAAVASPPPEPPGLTHTAPDILSFFMRQNDLSTLIEALESQALLSSDSQLFYTNERAQQEESHINFRFKTEVKESPYVLKIIFQIPEKDVNEAPESVFWQFKGRFRYTLFSSSSV